MTALALASLKDQNGDLELVMEENASIPIRDRKKTLLLASILLHIKLK